MSEPYPSQKAWKTLIERMGSEDAARKELARQLRVAADHVESNNWPQVFGCEVFHEEGKVPCEKGFIDTVSVTLSNPWPG